MAKIKVGVFGAQRGKVMIEVLASHPDAEIVAVCDRYVPALNAVKEIAEKYNVKIALYTDFEEFFLHDMDAVVLANYANEHAPYAIRCLRAGRFTHMPKITAIWPVRLKCGAVMKKGISARCSTQKANMCTIAPRFGRALPMGTKIIGETVPIPRFTARTALAR